MIEVGLSFIIANLIVVYGLAKNFVQVFRKKVQNPVPLGPLRNAVEHDDDIHRLAREAAGYAEQSARAKDGTKPTKSRLDIPEVQEVVARAQDFV